MKKILIYCLFIIAAILIIQSLFGQSFAKKSIAKLDSPYNTIATHLDNLQKDNYHPNVAAKALNTSLVRPDLAEELAIKLKRIYDGRGLFVNINDLPQNNDYIDTTINVQKYIIFSELPDIYLEKYGNKWLYSTYTVSQIELLYKSTFPIDSFDFIDTLPAYWKKMFLGIHLWQYSGFLLIIIICYALHFIIRWMLGYLLVKVSGRFFKHNLYKKYVKPLSKPLSVLIVTWIFTQLFAMLALPINISYILSLIVKAIVPILVTIIVYKLCDFFADLFEFFALKSPSNVDDHLVPFIRKGLKIIVVILGTLYLFSNIGINITPLLAGVSIGGLALALAAQDTVKNLFGSLTIFTDQPFNVGDLIKFDSFEGNVEEVGIRSTRIRTLYNSQISVPNGKLADSIIDNLGRREMRRFSFRISITYDTPPELIEYYVTGLRKIVNNHPLTQKDSSQIYLNDLADSAIIVLFHTFFSVPDWSQELKIRHEIIFEIIKLTESLGIRFAYPTQTLHVEDFPEKISKTPVFEINKDEVNHFLSNYEPFSNYQSGGLSVENNGE